MLRSKSKVWPSPVIVLVATSVLLCVGCGGEDGNDTDTTEIPRRGGVFRVQSEPPGTLDPVATDEVYESAVVRQIYDGLVRLDPDLRLLPGLASSWSISAGETVYTFQLRPGLRFHDGSPVTAADVAFSLARCISPEHAAQCFAAAYLEHIVGARDYREGRASSVKGIRILGERTLQIELESPLPIFLNALAMDQTVTLSKALIEREGEGILERRPIGCGPFRFVRRASDGGIVLASYKDYWHSRALLDTLIFQPIPLGEELSEVAALLDGRVDFATLAMGNSPLMRDAGFPVYRTPELSLAFLGLRVDKPPFDILEVRQAILLAVDRGKVQRVDPNGMVPVASLLPPGMPGRDPANRMPDHDPVGAARLLEQAGHPGGIGLAKIQIGTSKSPTSLEMTRMIASDMRSIGLDVETVAYEWRQLDSLVVGGHLQAFMVSWVADLPDPVVFLHPLFCGDGEANLSGYHSSEVDSLFENVSGMSAGPERIHGIRTLQEKILHDVPIVPLYHSSIAYSWRPVFGGIEVGPCGLAMIDMTRIHLDPSRQLHARSNP